MVTYILFHNCSRHIWWQLVSRRRRPVQKGIADLVHSYCLGQERSHRFRVILHCFERTKLNLFWNSVQQCCKPDLLVFCASTCDGNLACVIKHITVILLRNSFFVLAMLKVLWTRRNRLWVRILNNQLSVYVCDWPPEPTFVSKLQGSKGEASTKIGSRNRHQ